MFLEKYTNISNLYYLDDNWLKELNEELIKKYKFGLNHLYELIWNKKEKSETTKFIPSSEIIILSSFEFIRLFLFRHWRWLS
jgi:hypothetical protein